MLRGHRHGSAPTIEQKHRQIEQLEKENEVLHREIAEKQTYLDD